LQKPGGSGRGSGGDILPLPQNSEPPLLKLSGFGKNSLGFGGKAGKEYKVQKARMVFDLLFNEVVTILNKI
jgi:hypothetical protein